VCSGAADTVVQAVVYCWSTDLEGGLRSEGGVVGSWLAMHERQYWPVGGGRANTGGRKCAVRCAVVPQGGGAGGSIDSTVR
jgi:hypothetical protein